MSAFYKGRRVLVAGGSGMIGRPLVRLLLEAGARVRVASLDDPKTAPEGCEFTRSNLLEFKNALAACEGMELVFNLTGVKGSPAMTTTRPASFFVPTLTLDTNLMEAARQRGAERFLFASSVAVYGPAEVFHEDEVWKTFPSPNDRFAGWAKRMGELQAEAYKIEYGWDKIVITRPANVYGEHDNFSLDNAMVVPSLIRRAVSGEDPFKVWGDGTSRRDFVHAEDVARGMLLALEKPPPGPVNLGSGTGHTIQELVDVILACLPQKPRVEWDRSRPAGDKVRIMDIARARAMGWEPRVSLREGVKRTLDWYRARGAEAERRYDVFEKGRNERLLS